MIHKILTFLKGLFVPAGTAIMVVIVEGILGNRADGVFMDVWPLIERLIQTNLVTCVCTALVVGLCVFLSRYWQQRQKDTEHELAIEHELLKLDDSLLRALPALSSSSQLELEVPRIITSLLCDAITIFGGEVQRAALLVPNATGTYLECLAGYQMPQESIQNMRFYIGSDPLLLELEKGVSGEAFLSGEIIVGHLSLANGNLEYEGGGNYKRFVGRRAYSPYTSFVNVPIIGTDPKTLPVISTTRLGVLCFDSPNKKIFDSEESEQILRTIAKRTAIVLLNYHRYKGI